MSTLRFRLFCLLIFFVFTQGMWERIFVFIPQIGLLVDFFAVVFLLCQFKFYKARNMALFISFLAIAILIAIINGNPILDALLHIRYIAYSYLIFTQLYIERISSSQWLKMMKLVLIMIALQGVGSLFTFVVLGKRIEGYVGLMSSLGGTTATIFPLLVAGLLTLYFLFNQRIKFKDTLWIAVCLVSVLLVGYVSSKRTFYFAVPFFVIVSVLIALPALFRYRFFKRKLVTIFYLLVAFFPLVVWGIKQTHGLNYLLSRDETYYEVIAKSIQYAEEYETTTDEYNLTTGRSNTSLKAIENSIEDLPSFLFGKGYRSIKDYHFMYKSGYGYGVVGFSRDLISGGVLLMTCTILMYLKILYPNESKRSIFGNKILMLSLIVFIYTHFFYSADFSISLKISSILVIISAFLNSPLHYKSRCLILKRYNLITPTRLKWTN